MFAEISDAVWIALITGFNTALLSVIGIMAMVVKEYFDRQRAKDVAEKVIAVKEKLETTTDDQSKKLETVASNVVKTLHLCNSAMEEQKRLYMVKCEAAAKDNPSAVNKTEAAASRQAYEEHLSKQAREDKRVTESPS